MNEDFRYIAAIAKHGSISKAARAEHISQPGLSQRLRRLEAKLGCELFDRKTAPLKPTPTGEVVVRYALRAIAAEDNMRREVSSMINSHRQQLRIGVSMPRANALLAEPIVEFYESYHGCTVELHELETFDQLHNCFLTNSIDFAIFTPTLPDPQLYDLEVLCREQLVVVVSKELKIPQLQQAASGRVWIGQLEGVPFVLPTCGTYFDPIISHVIDDSRTQLDIVVRDCQAELALSLVEGGLGVSIVPSSYIAGRRDLRSYKLADVDAGNLLRYVRRRDKPMSLEEHRFMSILRNWIASCGDF